MASMRVDLCDPTWKPHLGSWASPDRPLVFNTTVSLRGEEARVLSDLIVDLHDTRGLHGIGRRVSGNTLARCACGLRLSRLAVV